MESSEPCQPLLTPLEKDLIAICLELVEENEKYKDILVSVEKLSFLI
jgi:hypothetical protein